MAGIIRPLLEIGGLKSPAFLALGLMEPHEVPHYKNAGFNLLWVEVKPEEGAIEKVEPLLSAASREGLGIVVHLRLDLLKKAPNPLDEGYVKSCKEFSRKVVGALRSAPNLLAWAVGGPVEPPLDDRSFQALLRQLYGDNIAALRTTWRAPLTSFEAVTLALPTQLDKGKPWGVGRPTLDRALCKMALVRRLYKLWASAVHEVDKKLPLVLAPTRLPRDFPLVPEEFKFVCTSPMDEALLSPETEDSFLVRMASRGGKFGAFHSISLKREKKVNPELLKTWMVSALLQGASGVLLEDWPTLSKNPLLVKAVSEVAERAKGASWTKLLPLPSGAVLFQPFSPGVIVKGEGAFGFVEALGEGDPMQLLKGLGEGTPFGPLDFLSLEEIELQRLSHYPVLFCPMSLIVTPEALRALEAFVEAGGVVCADLGFGGYDSVDGTLLYPSESVLNFLGVGAPAEVLDRPGGFIVAERHPLFPSLPPWSSTRLDAFPPPMTIVTMGLETIAYGLTHPGLTGAYWPDLAGVTIASKGRGFVVYGTMRLWASWKPEDPLFMPFHLDLLRKGETFEVVGGLGASFGREVAVWSPALTKGKVEVRFPFRPELPLGAWTYVFPRQRATMAPLRVAAQTEIGWPTLLRFAPVWAEPTQAPAYVRLERCDSKEVSLSVSSLSPLTLVLGVEIRKGPYPLPEGSKHKVIVLRPNGEVRSEETAVTHKGALLFTVRVRHGTVKVKALSAGEEKGLRGASAPK